MSGTELAAPTIVRMSSSVGESWARLGEALDPLSPFSLSTTKRMMFWPMALWPPSAARTPSRN